LSQVFHEIEKKIITSLKDNPKQTPETLGTSTKLSPDQIRRGIEWLKLKDLAIVDESITSLISLGKNGLESFQKGLPERRLLDLLTNGPRKLSDLQQELGSVFGPAIGISRKNNWVEATSDQISIKNAPSLLPGEKTLKQIGTNTLSQEQIDKNDLSILLKRPDFIIETITKAKIITLTDSAKSIILSDSTGAIDVEATVPETFVARTHPLKDTIDEIREIFVTLGFSEIIGNMTQSSFWNFDALFTPQDHPARELQDTFYLDGISAKKIATPEQIRKVSESHKKNWRYFWDINEARNIQTLYPIAAKVAKKINFSNTKATFGFTNETNIGMIFYTSLQSAPCFIEDKPVLIPLGVDQDPHFRLTRDIAPKIGKPKPALIHNIMIPGLEGPGGKMSASNENGTIYTTDSPDVVKKKINKYAFSGGQTSVEEHRKLGGNPDIDVSYQYLRIFFEQDDNKLKSIYDDYKSGKLLSGELKAILIEKINEFLLIHQEKREKAKDQINKFLFENK